MKEKAKSVGHMSILLELWRAPVQRRIKKKV